MGLDMALGMGTKPDSETSLGKIHLHYVNSKFKRYIYLYACNYLLS